MIRLFHISDFHLNKDNLYDWTHYTKDALVKLINDHQQDGVQSIVVCTGDLIDKGSSSDWGIEESLKKFKDEVMQPLVNATNLSLDRFVVVPGNHDIDRKKDKPFQANGLRGEFNKYKAKEINRFVQNVIDNGDYDGVKRMIPYKEFEAELYDGYTNVKSTFFGSSFIFDINGTKVGVTGFNSSWNAYDNDDKTQGLAIGEPQYNDCKDAIAGCDVKIALMHHPLDWLLFEKSTIRSWIFKEYTILCVGHVHEGDTSLTTQPYGTLFMDIAPSFTNDIRKTEQGAFANGLTCIEYDERTKSVTCYYYTFNVKSCSYVLNTNMAEKGYQTFNLTNTTSDALQDIIDNSVNYIKTHQYPIINSTLIPQKAHIIQNLTDAFVKPPIYIHGDEKFEDITLLDILKNHANTMLLGVHEAGKTVLLFRLLMELADNYYQYGVVPVYIDFLQIGNKDIESFVRDYLDLNSGQCNLLLESKKVVLLLDNYDPGDEHRYNIQKVYTFHHNYDIRIIATANTEMSNIIPSCFTQGANNLGLEYYHITQFKAAQVKELMQKWEPEEELGKRVERMDKMISSFTSYSLPCTPMSVSLYLWSRDEKHREPINKAVLLDIYISIILERLDKENIYQNTFDYKNKTMLLSRLASKILERGGFIMEYGDYIKEIEQYMKDVAFDRFSADRMGDFFIDRKIFVRRGEEVSFAHTCFFHYFLALRMIDDKKFHDDILKPNNFYKYEQVIDYYGGLVRNDKELLEFLHGEMESMFKPVKEIENIVNYDDLFTNPLPGEPAYKPVATEINVSKIQQNKPSEEEVEKRLEKVYDKKLEQISDDFNTDARKSPLLLIVMMSEALRNMDGVEDKSLKSQVYQDIIKNTLLYSVITNYNFVVYSIKHEGSLPPGFAIRRHQRNT